MAQNPPIEKNADPHDDVFSVEHLKGDLKTHSIRSGSVTLAGQFGKFVLHTASTMILARLLTKEDFGIVGMVMAVTNFIMMFKDMGLSAATIQRPKITQRQISTLFWINAAIGVGLALLTMTLAPLVAWFYGEPRLTPITMVLAGAFVFSGLTIQHQALLKRNMRFGAVVKIEVFAMFCSVAVAVIAALLGARYWSLVLMHLTMGGMICAGVWVSLRWVPGRPQRRAGTREMLGFGKNITLFHIVNYFSRNADKVLIGKYVGAATLGLYGRAHGLLMLPITQIRGPLLTVAVPALSRLQDDRVRFRKYYYKLVLLIAFLSMPLTIYLAICAKEAISVVLGEKWIDAAPFFQILALTAFIQPVSTTYGTVLLAMGQSRRFFRIGLMNSIALVFSFSIGITWGATGVAIAYAAATYTLLLPLLWYAYRKSPVTVKGFLVAIVLPASTSCIMGAVLLVCRALLLGQNYMLILATCLATGTAVYLGILSSTRSGRMLIHSLLTYCGMIFRRNR